jgi:hypothetical protein
MDALSKDDLDSNKSQPPSNCSYDSDQTKIDNPLILILDKPNKRAERPTQVDILSIEIDKTLIR